MSHSRDKGRDEGKRRREKKKTLREKRTAKRMKRDENVTLVSEIALMADVRRHNRSAG